jgi:8-oxo-dGTP pyrophosphatase MutT (NUDIX family)
MAYRALQILWLFTRPSLQGAKCLLTDGPYVLLVRHSYGQRLWDLPGGRVRRGEPPEACAGREIAEELGISVAEWEALGRLEVMTHRCRDTLHLFRAEVAAPPLELDLGEIEAARWFARAELPAALAPYVIPVLARTTVRTR